MAHGTYHISDAVEVKQKMLRWASRFNIFCFLDNQQYSVPPHQFECLLAAGSRASIRSADVKELDLFIAQRKGWLFGHIAYNLAAHLHALQGSRPDKIGFSPLHFFVPQYVFILTGNSLEIIADAPAALYKEVMEEPPAHPDVPSVSLQWRLSKEAYIEKIKKLQAHINRGECYEINFCQEAFAENVVIQPEAVFQRLMEVSPNPFSACYRVDDSYLLCASPERFLQKKVNTVFTQPIKGTIRRNLQNKKEDEALKAALKNSEKDKAENVMIVDLMRNDLSRICTDGTVTVPELFGIYSYPQVHQMISTITGNLKNGVLFSEILKAAFPMGSMTGAPKHRVMQLIDEYEPSARGIFSGSVGYINPDGDFDFNVVIRSIMYNATKKYLSYQVGSGITTYSRPESEWEECMLKGEAIKKVLTSGKQPHF